MKIKNEKKFREQVIAIKEALKGMSLAESEDFVLNIADASTLRALRSLQNELNSWGFTRYCSW